MNYLSSLKIRALVIIEKSHILGEWDILYVNYFVKISAQMQFRKRLNYIVIGGADTYFGKVFDPILQFAVDGKLSAGQMITIIIKKKLDVFCTWSLRRHLDHICVAHLNKAWGMSCMGAGCSLCIPEDLAPSD